MRASSELWVRTKDREKETGSGDQREKRATRIGSSLPPPNVLSLGEVL